MFDSAGESGETASDLRRLRCLNERELDLCAGSMVQVPVSGLVMVWCSLLRTSSQVQEAVASCNDERIYSFGVVLEALAHLNRTFDRSLKESVGVSQSTFEGLLRLERSGGELTMGELTHQISLTSGGVTRLVSRLVEYGYAQRRACEADRRVQYVSITDAGRSILAKAIGVHLADLETHFTGVMSVAERETIVAAMERIRQTSTA